MVLLQVTVICFQARSLRKARMEHQRKMRLLHNMISQLSAKANLMAGQVALAEVVLVDLRMASQAISKDIGTLINDSVETLAQHQLLK